MDDHVGQAAVYGGLGVGGLTGLAFAALLYRLPAKEIAFRREKRVALSMLDDQVGVAIEMANALLGLLGFGLYVAETYLEHSVQIKHKPYSWLLVCEVSFSVFFGLRFLLSVFFAPFRLSYVR